MEFVNSMKQRLLNKVNESFLLNNNNSTIVRNSLSKPSSRILSNENLLQTKTSLSPLKTYNTSFHVVKIIYQIIIIIIQ